MKLSTILTEFKAAFDAAGWITSGSIPVLIENSVTREEGETETFEELFAKCVEAGLAASGLVVILLPPAGVDETAPARGGRLCGKTSCGIALVARGGSYFATICAQIEDAQKTVMTAAGDDLMSSSWTRLSESGGDLVYVGLFDIRTTV